MSQKHFHSCPNCYEHVPCHMNCSIEYDLEDKGRQFGSYCLCDECDPKSKNSMQVYSKEWWDRYHGFIK